VSSTEPEKLNLSGAERDLAARLAENPMDLFQGKSIGWLEDFIRITVGSGGSTSGTGSSGTSAAYYVPGDIKVTLADLTAQTSEYVFEDDSGQWLYCNGVAVSQTTYADLYAAIGANAYGTDSGGNFFLPDPRGRALFFTGTHTDADLGDNDGVALASRTAKHSHTNGVSASITGSPDAGTLAITPNPHSHPSPSSKSFTGAGTSIGGGSTNDVNTATETTALSITGSPSAGTLGVSVGGTIGTGTPVDTPAHLFIGSLLVRF
jgi:microcystin-dependent protein